MFESLNLTQRNGANIGSRMVTTANELHGYKILRSMGLVKGVIVRSRSALGTVGASFQTMVGGDITLFNELCENARRDALARMMEDAAKDGANAIIAARYDANELAPGVTEVLAYGTAVAVEKLT